MRSTPGPYPRDAGNSPLLTVTIECLQTLSDVGEELNGGAATPRPGSRCIAPAERGLARHEPSPCPSQAQPCPQPDTEVLRECVHLIEDSDE